MTILLSDYKCEQPLIVDGWKVDPEINGQIVYGNLLSYDAASHKSSFIYTQEASLLEIGGFTILDFDPITETVPTAQDVVASFGFKENPDNLGTKLAGVLFENPTYPSYVGTLYNGNVTVQSLILPYVEGQTPRWTFPNEEGAPGSAVTTDGAGNLYWTEPANPPNIVEDIDTTDFLIDPSPLWSTVPVTVTATQPSIPAQVSLDISFFTNNQNQTIRTRMLVNGVQTGQVYSVPMPRAVPIEQHYSWSPVLPLGTEVITIEVQHDGGQPCFVYGATDEPTVLRLLEQGGVASARVQNTDFVISREDFATRFLTVERENRAKFLNRRNIGMGVPAWEDVDYIFTLSSRYSTGNVNLLDQDVIDGINYMETLGILAPGRAAVILTP